MTLLSAAGSPASSPPTRTRKPHCRRHLPGLDSRAALAIKSPCRRHPEPGTRVVPGHSGDDNLLPQNNKIGITGANTPCSPT